MSIFDDWDGEAWEDDGSSWSDTEVGDNIQDYDWSNIGDIFDTGWDSGFDSSNWGNYDNGSTGSLDLSNPSYNYDYSGGDSNTWGNIEGSVKNVLSDLFTKGTTANTIGQVGAALLSGYQNKQKASSLQKAASQIDPWASQRSYYQTQAKNTITDPYNQPIVAAQIAQLQKAQNAKDAAAGRRSNSLMGSTAVMDQAAKIAQAYQAQMAAQGGSNIQPDGLSSILTNAAQADTDGYLSPLANLFGTTSQSNANANTLSDVNAATKLAALQKFIQGGYQ